MPTMYILRLKYVCYFTGSEATIPFEAKWCIKSVEKETYTKKIEHHRLFLQMILIRTMTTFSAIMILKKEGPNPNIPGFLSMKLC
jgi:hypothetical protein